MNKTHKQVDTLFESKEKNESFEINYYIINKLVYKKREINKNE